MPIGCIRLEGMKRIAAQAGDGLIIVGGRLTNRHNRLAAVNFLQCSIGRGHVPCTGFSVVASPVIMPTYLSGGYRLDM